mgnify:CR=1 FL=1
MRPVSPLTPTRPPTSSRHAADVGDVGGAFSFEHIFQCQVFQLHFVLAYGGVDGGQIGASGHHTVVAAGHTADKVVAVHAAVHGAPADNTVRCVHAGNAADLVGAAHGAGKPAVFDGSGVFTRKTVHIRPGTFRLYGGGQGGLPHHGVLLNVAEQPLHAAVGGEGQSADGVAVSFPAAAEGGNPPEVRPGQVDVGVQINGQALAPAVQPAVFGQLDQVVGGTQVKGGGGFFRQCRRGQTAQKQRGAQQGTQPLSDCHAHHTSSPSV